MRLSGRRKKEKDANGNRQRNNTATGIPTATSAHSDCTGGTSGSLGDNIDSGGGGIQNSNKEHRRSLRHSSSASAAICGTNINRIQEVQLNEINLNEEYDVQQILAEGCFAKILLATNRSTRTTVVLKGVHAELTTLKDFQREYHYSYHLSPHPFILSSYAVCFQADNCFFFAQEYAPLGDLSGCVHSGGLPEKACKEIARQLASALDFLHTNQLVHRDLKLENVLVFQSDLSKIKLCDFGATRNEGALVSKPKCSWPPFVPPELYEMLSNERYHCRAANDTWQLGILLFVCLTGSPPWQSADCIGDLAYANFWRYQKRRITKVPHQFTRFSSRLLRMFRRMFEHKPDKRSSVTEVNKYLNDNWVDSRQGGIMGCGVGTVPQLKRADSPQSGNKNGDRLSDDASKTRLKRLLSSYGLETTVDQKVVTKRVWDWVLQCEAHPVTDPSIHGSSQALGSGSNNCSITALPVC